MDLPTGTVTFLFTDVEGSTRLVQALGAKSYGEVLETHRRLLRDVFSDTGGVEVDSAGDGLFVVFRSAADAVRAAVGAQRGLAAKSWPENGVVRVRMGVHTGEASVADSGYRGLAVHRAARICAAAHGGQIIVSSTTHDVVEADLPPDVRLRDLGSARLPDLDRPEKLFQLVVDGLPDTFPPVRTRSAAPAPPDRVDLLEREAELTAIDALIAAVASGGRLLAIEGPAGIGKTRLLAETRARAAHAGLRVLTARGSELEVEFPFGVVRQLFEPLLAAAQPDERAELLAGAAELATPIFDPASLAGKPDAESSLAALHGLFWLTANCAEREPTLLALDDLQWCDTPSLRWLAYLLPRLEGLRLLVVAGLRHAEPGAAHDFLARIIGDPLSTVVRPGALSEAATGRLLGSAIATDLDPEFRAALHEASGGNPFFVRELVNSVTAEGLAGRATEVPRIVELSGQGVSRAVAHRLSRLSPAARSLTHAVAIFGDDVELRLAAALAGLREATAVDTAAQLGRIELFRRGFPLAFAHPVVRTAVYAELSAVEKERGHARAARLLAETGAQPEQVAAQLLLASVSDDAWASETLRSAARSALARGAPESAVAYLRRAVVSATRAEADLLHELGLAETMVATPEALDHLTAARAAATDARTRARIGLDLGRAVFSIGGSPQEAVATLELAIKEVAELDPELALELETELIGMARFEPELFALASERLWRLRVTLPENPEARQVALANLSSEAARAGTEREEAVAFARRALADDTLSRRHFDPAFLYAVLTLVSADELDAAGRHLREAREDATRRGLVSQFCFASLYGAFVALKCGALADAVADGELSLAAIDLHRLDLRRRYAAAILSEALIEQGEHARAREQVDLARLGDRLESYGEILLYQVRAHVRLADGDGTRALDDFLEIGAFLEGVGVRNPAVAHWRSGAARALFSLGDVGGARAYAREELALARTWGAPHSLGRSLIAAGIVEGGAAGSSLFEEAVAVLASSQCRLEHAKALVELGAARRRANRRADAREPLRRGLELASECGAVPLVERAETELRATGARPRRVALSGLDSLTPSEKRVAELAADGSTNREIAQALFVTQKTVEVHLSSAYRKLGIDSRTQLAKALAGGR